MTEPNQAVVDEMVREGESAGERDMVRLIERHHDGPGVGRETVEAYARELEDRRDYAFDADAFLADVDRNTSDADRWDGGHYYELGDGRISTFPSAWHDRLGGSTDVTEYIRFIEDEQSEYLEDLALGGPGAGVPEAALLQALEVVGRVDRETASTAIHEARDQGKIIEDADQSPDADVYLRDRAPDDLL